MAAAQTRGQRLVLFGLTIVEEISELMGSTLVVSGAWELLRVAGVRLTRLPERPGTP